MSVSPLENPPEAGLSGRAERVRVKVCGVTCAQDAFLAVRAGADALGFNTWRGSRRWLDLRAASGWMAQLPPFVSRVVLCINAPLEEALEIAALPVVDCIQFHGDETREYLAEFALRSLRPFIRAVRLADESALDGLDCWGTTRILLDAAVPGSFGGTGAPVNLDLARRAVERFPHLNIILAGGLDPHNVRDAVARVCPYAVDVASGVESPQPGRKDFLKMADFVQAVTQGVFSRRLG